MHTDVTETRHIVRNDFTNVFAWPAITYVSSIVITKQQCKSDLDAHALPFEIEDDRLYWVKMRRVVRVGNQGTELNIDEVPPDKKKSMLKYKENEEASWQQIEKRIRNQYIVGKAFTPQPRIKSSEIVLRYLDSRSNPDHDAPVVVEDHELQDIKEVGLETKKKKAG